MHQLIFPASLFSPLYSGPVYQVIGLDLEAFSRYASSDQECIANENSEKADTLRVPVYVMSNSPYGGCSLDLGDYEDVLLVAGGADVTFTLGLLDDLIGGIVRHQRVRNERTLRVEFVWIVRSVCKLFPFPTRIRYFNSITFQGHIQWFESMLLDITEMAADHRLTSTLPSL
jgi:hypothetical protein